MCWFFKKPVRRYPSLYTEWLHEFERIGSTYIKAQDSETFRTGALTDKKYSLDNFKRRLSEFLEIQLKAFFAAYTKEVEEHALEENCEYLILVIRRNMKKYKDLYFFESLDFLDAKYKEKLSSELDDKLKQFIKDLHRYFAEIEKYTDSMYEVSLNLKRLIEV